MVGRVGAWWLMTSTNETTQLQKQILATICPSPFSPHREDIYFTPGATVTEILEQYAPRGLTLNAHVWQADHYIAREDWATFIPTDTLSIRVVPMGSDNKGKNTLRFITGLAAIAMGGWMFVGSKIALALSLGTKMAFTVGAGLTAAASWGLFQPLQSPGFGTNDGPVYSVTGSQNRVNRYGVVPRAYGTIKMFPPLACMPYTEIAGNDQYINILYCFGYGPLNLNETTLKIGDDLMASLPDAEYYLGSGFTNAGAESTVVPELFSNTCLLYTSPSPRDRS